jgi:hypothetical protein
MIKIEKNTIQNVYLTLFESSENKCDATHYLFEIKSKNNNEYSLIILEDVSTLEERLRFNRFIFDLINNTDLIDIFTLTGTYVFSVFEYDMLDEVKLNKVQTGMFYIEGEDNFQENGKSVEYYIYE